MMGGELKVMHYGIIWIKERSKNKTPDFTFEGVKPGVNFATC